MLDALENALNLDVNTTNSAARRFCDDAVKLCGETSLFRGKPFVRQVVDAREARRPVTAPLAVADDGYWWIFKVRDRRLSEVLLVCAVEREHRSVNHEPPRSVLCDAGIGRHVFRSSANCATRA